MCRSIQIVAAAILFVAGPASGQDDVITRARVADSAGQRAEALAMLKSHLASSPNDVDARLVFGLMLSWDKRYDEARTELRQVLLQAPDYKDARVALMNVDWWSGRTSEASDLAVHILKGDPGDPQARFLRQRLDARTRPWRVTTDYSLDAFNDGGESWHEFAISIARETPSGPIFVRGTNATRFGHRDQLIEVEAYPSFRPGTYAYVNVGAATRRDLYPDYRAAFDLYQVVGRGLELSGGYRRLQFSTPVSIYVGTATKYLGQWALLERVSFVPGGESDAWSFHTESRRYLGGAGTSFLAAAYSYGFNREEPRGLGDSIRLRTNTVRGQVALDMSPRTRVMLTIGTSRQERAFNGAVWQTTLAASTAYKF
jgi:YaiO family outer membrane protein